MSLWSSLGIPAFVRNAFLTVAILAPVSALSQNISTLVGGAGDGSAGTSASLDSPTGVALDGANGLYIAEGSGRVGRLDLVSGIYRHYAEFPAAIRGVAVDAGGNVYFSAANEVYRVDPVTRAAVLYAGGGPLGFGGDGGPAVSGSTRLNMPSGLAFDAAGNLYIADRSNNRIRHVSAGTGTISTVAGSGTEGLAGDGGAATSAALRRPEGVAVDSAGNLYIADNFNNRVRRVDAVTGVISTLTTTSNNAKSVAMGLSGAIVVSEGSTFPRVGGVDTTSGVVTSIAGTGIAGFSGDGGNATSATLSLPAGVAVDSSGDVYIADAGNHRIRKVSAASGTISTVAGAGPAQTRSRDGVHALTARLHSPAGLAVDGSGNTFVVEAGGHRLRLVNAITGQITTLAGTGTPGYAGHDGTAANTMLASPDSVALSATGDVYLTDVANKCIRKIATGTGLISRFAGVFCGANAVGEPVGDGGLATSASVKSPRGIAVDEGGNVYWVDPDVEGVRVRRVNTSNIISTVAGGNGAGFLGDGTLATAAKLNAPRGLAYQNTGNLYIADAGNHRVRRVDGLTGMILTKAGTGAAEFSGDSGPATSAGLNAPESMVVDADANLYIADTTNHRVRRVDAATGNITTVAGTGMPGFSPDGTLAIASKLSSPHGLAMDGAGGLLVSDRGNNLVRRFPLGGGPIMTVAGTVTIGLPDDGEAGSGVSIAMPSDLVRNAAGDIYFTDTENHAVRRWIASADRVETLAGDGTAGYAGDGELAGRARLNSPSAIALDGSGNVFISDYGNRVIRRIDSATGMISTYAGNGIDADTGDGGQALSAGIVPGAIAFDAGGNLLVLARARLRRIDGTTATITTIAGDGTIGDTGDGGPALAATIQSSPGAGWPGGLAIDGAGNIFIATGGSKIRRIDALVGTISTVAGGGPLGAGQDGLLATASSISAGSLAVDAMGNIIFGSNSSVRMVVAATGTIATVAGAAAPGYFGDGGPALDARLDGVRGIRVDSSGNVYVADGGSGRIRTFTIPATSALSVAKAGAGDGTVTSSVVGIACGGDCGEAFPFGIPVTLTATASQHSSFAGWTGACAGTSTCTLVMNAAKQVTATFEPQACLSGSWSATGNAPCTLASAGHFVTTSGATSETACSPGTYQPNQGATGCIVAPAGHFVAGSAATSPAACGAGTYQPAVGQPTCLPAPAGSYVGATAAISPSTCPVGRYQPLVGQSSCILADPGRYVPSTGATTQLTCAIGTYQPNSGAAACGPASPGYYVPEEGMTAQIPCAAGNYQPALGASVCLPAPAGHFVAAAGRSSATPCPAGKYQPTTGATGCLEASVGHYVPAEGAISQTPCGAGTYQRFTAQSWCAFAEPGFFVPTSGAADQIACPAGRTTYLQGASSCVPYTTRGDTNRDGRADIFWREAAPAEGLSLWRMNGSSLASSSFDVVDAGWQIADVGDLDGDNKADVVWRRASDGATYLWLLDGFAFKGFFDLGVLDPAAWSLVGAADLDGDGKDDIVWRGTDGTVYGWLMNGGVIASQGVISNPGSVWVIADLADMDGDGKADIVFRNTTDGGVYVYFMNGLSIASGGYVGAVDPAAWTLVGAADFNGDGKADFLWRHTSGDTWVWLMNGATFQAAGGIGNPGTSWSVRSLGDFDGDGRSDLVWRHIDGTTYLWRMNGLTVSAYDPIANPGGSWEVVAP